MTPVGRWYEAFRDSAMRWARSTFGHPGERLMGYVFFLPDIVRLLIHLPWMEEISSLVRLKKPWPTIRHS